MIISSAFCRKLKMPWKILWVAFSCYGPVALFVMARFRWPILVARHDLGAYLVYSAIVSGVCAFITAVVYLVQAPWKMALPLLVFLLDFSLLFSPLQGIVVAKGFADFIYPPLSYRLF